LLLLLVAETSSHVAPYVQVSGACLSPKCIVSHCLCCVATGTLYRNMVRLVGEVRTKYVALPGPINSHDAFRQPEIQERHCSIFMSWNVYSFL